MTTDRTRRRTLRLGGASLAALTGLAGCAGLNRFRPASGDRETPGGTATSTASATSSATPATGTPGPTTTTPQSTTTQGPPSTTDQPTTEAETAESAFASRLATPEFSFADAAVPADPRDHTYALMGDADAAATATVYGNWKCPYTREFVVRQLDGIYREFVRPGDLAVRFRGYAYRGGDPHLGPDAPRAARAGLAVWTVDPARFWRYLGTVFANQPTERREWATADTLAALAAAAGVRSSGSIAAAAETDRFVPAVRETARVAPARGVTRVPRVVVGDTVTAPTVDLDATMTQLRRAIRR